MTIQVVAELLSALAAFVTIGLACIELYSRNYTKKAENAIDIYSEYLFVTQQLEYAVNNIAVLSNNSNRLTPNEIKAFAENHILDDSLTQKIQKIENISISSFDYNKEKGRINSQAILDFTGRSLNLINTINTFYTIMMNHHDISGEWVGEKASRVQNEFTTITGSIKATGELLHQNLKSSHNMSNTYIVLLFALSVAFFLLCIFL